MSNPLELVLVLQVDLVTEIGRILSESPGRALHIHRAGKIGLVILGEGVVAVLVEGNQPGQRLRYAEQREIPANPGGARTRPGELGRSERRGREFRDVEEIGEFQVRVQRRTEGTDNRFLWNSNVRGAKPRSNIYPGRCYLFFTDDRPSRRYGSSAAARRLGGYSIPDNTSGSGRLIGDFAVESFGPGAAALPSERPYLTGRTPTTWNQPRLVSATLALRRNASCPP